LVAESAFGLCGEDIVELVGIDKPLRGLGLGAKQTSPFSARGNVVGR
jgi:hypothetical protein